MTMQPKTVRALIVPQTGPPELRTIGTELDDLKQIVGGWLEPVSSSYDADWHAYCNEEGKLVPGASPNLLASGLASMLGWVVPGDWLVGDVVFLGSGPTDDPDDGPYSGEADVPQRVLNALAALAPDVTLEVTPDADTPRAD